METEKWQKAVRRVRVQDGTGNQDLTSEKHEDRNKRRRTQYANDVDYAEQQRKLARESYNRNKNTPARPSLAGGLLAGGTVREVEASCMEYPAVVESFTIGEAARALGKTEFTVRRWIEDDLIPEPIYRDTVRGHPLYSLGEIRIIGAILGRHEIDFSYYLASHTRTREEIMQAIHAYRALNV